MGTINKNDCFFTCTVIQILVILQQLDEKYEDKMETALTRKKVKFYQANMEFKTTGRILNVAGETFL